MVEQEPRLVNSATAARTLGVDPATLWRWQKAGRVTPAWTTPGGHARWNLSQLRQQLSITEEATHVTDPTTKPVAQPVVAAVVTCDKGMLVTWRNDKTPPAGFLSGEIEPGESPADAMVRECKEEAAIRVKAGNEIGRRVHPRTGRTMIYVAGEPVEESDIYLGDDIELSAVRWVTLAEADEAFAAFGGMFPPVHDYLVKVLGA